MDDNGRNYVLDEQGDIFSLFIRQPFAQMFAQGGKTIEIRKESTPLRGDILLCSTRGHQYGNALGGCCVGVAELYNVKPVCELTADEWEQTRIPRGQRRFVKKGYSWMLRNAGRIVEYPVKQPPLKCGFIKFNLDDIFFYPQYLIYDIRN